ncbi:MAG: family 78 glycoside hydrolase catalytic domain [Lentisphaeria bacterium]|nr:family 78 glycoside hydrolase catalytic domain [Lentisphaeria bacterium]
MSLKSRHLTARLAGAVLLLGTICTASLCGCSEKMETPVQTIVENDEPPVFPAVPAEAKSVLEEQTADSVREFDGGVSVLDFGKDAYCHLVLTLKAEREGKLEVLVGEVLKPNGRIEENPGGSRICYKETLTVKPGEADYLMKFPPHKNPYGGMSRPQTPEIAPFRYVEIRNPGGVEVAEVVRVAHFPEFDDDASKFECDIPELVNVWEFCKYSVKACVPFGLYIDGNRERMPYEADSYVTALSHFAVDANYAACRASIEWSLDNPTWPTEWRLLMPELVKVYLLYSGDFETVRGWYERLKPFLLSGSLDEHGFLTAKRLPQGVRDIVDWPEGERDGYEMKDVNFVPNAFRHLALLDMAYLAEQTGHADEAAQYRREAAALNICLHEFMFDGSLFVDSPGSKHHSVHSQMAAVCTGVAQEVEKPAIAEFLKGKDMACSVYGAQYLLDACFELGLGEHAVELMTSDGLRSWRNMLRAGATVTMEAWDNSVKPNQDWNHSWSTAPANVVARRLFGIRPLAPGFAEFCVEPAPCLKNGSYCQPTPLGPIKVMVNGGHVNYMTYPEQLKRVRLSSDPIVQLMEEVKRQQKH